MKFVDAILSNNSTDDHCREFVSQGGLVPLLSILGLPNLPVDYPVVTAAQAVASVCKSILVSASFMEVIYIASICKLTNLINYLRSYL
jgi:E3 ubiquitin-protein ligase HUWE1